MAPAAHEDIERAVEVALLKKGMSDLTAAVTKLTDKVEKLTQAQAGAKFLGGAVVYFVPVASFVMSVIVLVKTGAWRP